METMTTDSWKRRGISLLWGADSLTELATPAEVVSIRLFFEMTKKWPEDLPSNQGRTLVVAGLEGCMDVLHPEDAEIWLGHDLKTAIRGFQDEYEQQTGLIFWIPSGRQRVHMNFTTESYFWRCAPPNGNMEIPLGRILWSGAETGVCRLINPSLANQDADGPAWIGLHLSRIS